MQSTKARESRRSFFKKFLPFHFWFNDMQFLCGSLLSSFVFGQSRGRMAASESDLLTQATQDLVFVRSIVMMKKRDWNSWSVAVQRSFEVGNWSHRHPDRVCRFCIRTWPSARYLSCNTALSLLSGWLKLQFIVFCADSESSLWNSNINLMTWFVEIPDPFLSCEINALTPLSIVVLFRFLTMKYLQSHLHAGSNFCHPSMYDSLVFLCNNVN